MCLSAMHPEPAREKESKAGRRHTMSRLLRHLAAIALLPFVVTVVVPTWLARQNGVTLGVSRNAVGIFGQGIGVILIAIGLTLFVASLRRFATEGEGTLAPWDPPRRLVLLGPYRYVRNPMISGVVFVVFGEALLLSSTAHLEWALLFLGMNLVYIPLLEEPQLKRRFGSEYGEYCRHVPRIFPRFRAWQRDDAGVA